ncbi:MAG: glycosyltransferase family 1 protein [Pontibacterium sp.]
MTSLIVEECFNPSSDFFVYPWLVSEGKQLTTCSITGPDSLNKVCIEAIDELIFVRYFSRRWYHWVEQHRGQLKRLAFFMDDDLFDFSAHSNLPLRYRWKLYRLAWRHQCWLRRMGAELWVSNQWLADKYSDWKPKLLQPHSAYGYSQPKKTLFYHGSASHKDEIQWLLPVVEAVLSKDENLSFEIIGSQPVRSLFAHLSRVHVLHPMKWPAYKALLDRPGRTIGLAPLLDSGFNCARSFTKFFDITQAGAAGIYADHPVYRSVINHGENGLLLPMDQQQWINSILKLSNAADERERILAHARQCL